MISWLSIKRRKALRWPVSCGLSCNDKSRCSVHEDSDAEYTSDKSAIASLTRWQKCDKNHIFMVMFNVGTREKKTLYSVEIKIKRPTCSVFV